MKRSKYYRVLGIIFMISVVQNVLGQSIYKNPNVPIEKRVSDLLSKMTIEEKIEQLDMYWGKEVTDMDGQAAAAYSSDKMVQTVGKTGIGAIHDFYPVSAALSNAIQKYAMEKTRLGIPALFIEEGLHGYAGKGSTMFPVPIMLSSAWDTLLVHKLGRVIATEARAHGVDMILGPVLGLAREPRWGRVEETYGEDPYLDACNGVAMVKGLQGKSLSGNNAVIAEPKHFAVHSIPEAGSNTSPVSVGEREMRSDFLYVFEKAVREGGAMGIMAAYHDLDGIPCVDNKWLLTDVLRKEWGFKGFVLSDLGAIKMSLENHNVATETSDALAQTLKAGLNMQFYDFGHAEFKKAILEALKKKMLLEEDLNKAVRDILRVKFSLGLFDHPYTDTTLVSKVFHTDENQQFALQAAQEGIVLLKNDSDLLPIKKNINSVAVIGQLATSIYLGDYCGDAKGISVLDGLKQRCSTSVKFQYARGYALDDSTKEEQQSTLLKDAVDMAKQCDVSIVVLGEPESVDGEGKDRDELSLDEHQMNLVKAIYQTGVPTVVVLENGRPLTINWIAKHIPSIVESWYGGEKGGLAIADILLGNVNPSGKLPITFPRSVGQIPFYYNHKPTSYHKYVDDSDIPLFPFGYGLSYTTFKYSDMQITPSSIPITGDAIISVTVENTGKVRGAEVVQLYVRDEISSVTTPILALKGFQRITLKPGEKGVVRFKLTSDQLSLWNREMKRVVEPGMFKIMVGSSSADIRQTGSLSVEQK